MTDPIESMRFRIAELGRLMFDRFITDTAGGNISARVGDLVCITSRHSGSKYQWRIRPEQVLVSDLQGNKLEGEGELSREAKTHFRLLNDFPDGKAIVHCHPRHVMVFAIRELERLGLHGNSLADQVVRNRSLVGVIGRNSQQRAADPDPIGRAAQGDR